MPSHRDDTEIAARRIGEAYEQAERRVAASMRGIRASLENIRRDQRRASRVSRDFGRAFSSAFEEAALRGKSLSDTLRQLALDLSRSALRNALGPAATAGGNILASLFGAARGAVFARGGVQAFARGGVIREPTLAPLARGAALIGEAGPEAVLPLRRGADGRLGVSSSNANAPRSVNLSVNISTPDIEGFRQSETQIASILRRAVMRGARNI